jgi:anti-sigma factor RsiW
MMRRDGPCDDDAARLLPWLVNGTLDADAAARVQAHVERCALCRDDIARLDAMRELLRAPALVEHAPHGGLRKLMARVDGAAAIDAAAPPSRAPVPVAESPPRDRPALRGAARWLAAAVALQACVIAVLVVLALPRPEAPAAYRTLTAPAADGPRLRVVFAPATTLAELQDVLRAHRLVAVAGPSEAGLFTLALQAPATERDDAVARLRADPRVRFAEAVGE